MTLRRLFTHWGTATGLFILAFVVIAALGAQWIIPYDPLRMSVGPRLTPPSAAHWFGTDELGRDLFSRVLTGTRGTALYGSTGGNGVIVIVTRTGH